MMKDGCAKRHSLSMYNGHRAEPDARFLMYPTEQILETHPSRLSECRGQGTLEFTVREGQTQACHHGRVPSLGSGMRDREPKATQAGQDPPCPHHQWESSRTGAAPLLPPLYPSGALGAHWALKTHRCEGEGGCWPEPALSKHLLCSEPSPYLTSHDPHPHKDTINPLPTSTAIE